MRARRTIQRWLVAASLPLLFRAGTGCAQIAGIQAADSMCGDGIQNQDETGIDCGGVCGGRCPGEGCKVADDCANGLCGTNHLCAKAPCVNAVKDGAETDVDCGGGTCPTCALGKSCSKDGDCQSTKCTGGVCTPCLHCAEVLTKGLVSDVSAMMCLESSATYEAYYNCACTMGNGSGCKDKCLGCIGAGLITQECKSCIAMDKCSAATMKCTNDKAP